MIAVIFEATPVPGKWDEYLNIAASLKPELNKIKGFISIDRYQSIGHPEKVLSLSFWEDEESITAWRNVELHRMAQHEGRIAVFADYRIRVAAVVRDYGLNERSEAPQDSKPAHK